MLIMQLLVAGTMLGTLSPVEPKRAASPFDVASLLDEQVLNTSTAREDIAQVATAEQSARVSNNSVSGTSTTGSVRMDGNAFQNVSGLVIVNANSGNNVAINAAMNVNIVITPQP